VGRYVKDLARLQDVRGTGDRQLEGAAEEQGPLLVGMRVLGDDGARSDIDSALRDLVGVHVASEIAGSDLTRSHGGEVEESHGNPPIRRHVSTNMHDVLIPVESRGSFRAHLRVDPAFAVLRGNARFERLVEK
jgi:hypothetical protein